MKKSNIGAIIRKEFNRFFTDRRLVMTAIILPGLMIYLLYSFMGSAMSNMYSVEDDFAPTVYAVNAPDSIAALAQEAGMTLTDVSPQEAEERARKAAEFVGLSEDFLDKSPFELSGGEKRRVAIAGVIAMDPDVLVLDEPTAGLDPRGRDVLLAQITSYHKVRGNTVLLVSHSMEDIACTADRILVMNDSHAAMFDETAKIFARDKELEAMGLRVPQITKILSLLRERGWPVGTALTMEEAVRQLLPLLEKGGVRP